MRTHLWSLLSLHLQRQKFPWNAGSIVLKKRLLPRALRSGCLLLGSHGRGFPRLSGVAARCWDRVVVSSPSPCRREDSSLGRSHLLFNQGMNQGDNRPRCPSPAPARSFLCSWGSQELAISADTCRAHPPCQACLARWDLMQSWEAGQSPAVCPEHPEAEGLLTCPRWSCPGQPRPSMPAHAQPHHCLWWWPWPPACPHYSPTRPRCKQHPETRNQNNDYKTKHHQHANHVFLALSSHWRLFYSAFPLKSSIMYLQIQTAYLLNS